MEKKRKRGGAMPGAGRPPLAVKPEPTTGIVSVRVGLDIVEWLKKQPRHVKAELVEIALREKYENEIKNI